MHNRKIEDIIQELVVEIAKLKSSVQELQDKLKEKTETPKEAPAIEMDLDRISGAV